MEIVATAWWERLLRSTRTLLFIALAVMLLQQLCGPARVAASRADLLDRLQQQRGSRVIAMIHRQDTVSLFGVPVSSSIGIEDSEAVLRAIRLTPPEQPIDLILHTPGGLVLAAGQIALALLERPGKVTVFVPHYAMCGGTLLALTADEIVMDAHAVLGPVDPQIGDMPAASIVKLLDQKRPSQISDEMLVLTDVAQKARGLAITSCRRRSTIRPALARNSASDGRCATVRTHADSFAKWGPFRRDGVNQ